MLRRIRTQQLLLTNMPTEQLTLPTDETYAMAVADGMGGMRYGALASEIAIRTGWDLAGRTTSWVMKLENLDSAELTERIEGFVYMMQQAFVHEYQANPQFGNSGTTFTSAYFVSSFAAISQIGDSPMLPVARWHDAARVGRSHDRAGVHFGRRRAGNRRQVQPHADPLPGLRIAERAARTSISCDSSRAINCSSAPMA